MTHTSQLVKGVGDGIGVSGSQMNVDCGTVNGAVPKPGLEGKKVKAILIAVGRVRVAQGVGGETGVHAKLYFVVKDDFLEPLLIHGVVRIGLLSKEPGMGLEMAGAGIPIISNILTNAFRNGDKTVGVVLGYRDVKPV